MATLRTLVTGLAGLALAGIVFVFTAAIGLFLFGLAAVAMLATAVAVRISPSFRARMESTRQRKADGRVWDDGKGTIIDM